MPSSARCTNPRPRCRGGTAGPRLRPTSAASIPSRSIGAPLWLSGEHPRLPELRPADQLARHRDVRPRRIQGPKRIAEVILGDRKFVNTEAPHAIEGLRCSNCGTAIADLRSFKCHNWAYAIGDLQAVVADLAEQPR